jgi:hypothetical protein
LFVMMLNAVSTLSNGYPTRFKLQMFLTKTTARLLQWSQFSWSHLQAFLTDYTILPSNYFSSQLRQFQERVLESQMFFTGIQN